VVNEELLRRWKKNKILDQLDLGRGYTDDAIINSMSGRPELIARHLQLVDAKVKASYVLVRLRELRAERGDGNGQSWPDPPAAITGPAEGDSSIFADHRCATVPGRSGQSPNHEGGPKCGKTGRPLTKRPSSDLPRSAGGSRRSGRRLPGRAASSARGGPITAEGWGRTSA